MSQQGPFVGKRKIQKWCTDDPRYPALVKVGTDLTITETADTFTLQWKDQCEEPCTLTGLKLVGGKLEVKSSEIKGRRGLPPQLSGATVELADDVHGTLEVTLYFSLDQDGPKGTITAEVNPPIELPVLARLWRWLRSLFLRLFSLFR